MGPAQLATANVSLAAPASRRFGWPVFLAALGFASFLSFYGLGGELWRTENLRARVAWEILHTGDWVVPRLYGEPLLTKPPAMYIAIALASLPRGLVTEWTARLPSALSALAMLALFYLEFRRRLGQRAGIIAAVLLPISGMWLDKSTSAEIDMLHAAWVCGAFLCFLRAVEANEKTLSCSRAETWWWLGSLLCVAGGFLTKWTAPLFFYTTVLSFLAWHGRFKLLRQRAHLIALLVAALCCLGWLGAAIWKAGWTIVWATIVQEAGTRLTPWCYGLPYSWRECLLDPARLIVAMLPCSAVALMVSRPNFARMLDEQGRRLWQLCMCWVWPNVLVWAFVSDHAVRHRFPILPGMAGLAALGWLAWLDGRVGWPALPRPRLLLVTLLASWVIVKFAYVHAIMPMRVSERGARGKGEQIAALVPAGKPLHVFDMADRDEGILFYYGRPIRKLEAPGQLASDQGGEYAFVSAREWQSWPRSVPVSVRLRMRAELRGDVLLIETLPGRDARATMPLTCSRGAFGLRARAAP
jgi:4-amino-4-deoxy-L-arabinose transferase-like glycosyltransferase